MPPAFLPDISAGKLKGATGSSIIGCRALEIFSHFQTATFNLDAVRSCFETFLLHQSSVQVTLTLLLQKGGGVLLQPPRGKIFFKTAFFAQ